jgi:5-methyltetrahydrofolate--homocysteine methyltransferase
MIDEVYKGIRPAGYPCPDHLETYYLETTKRRRRNRSNLDRSMAMWPASSVSGYYFAHPESNILDWKIKEDQVIDYAKRRSISTDKAMKWLGPNIAD